MKKRIITSARTKKEKLIAAIVVICSLIALTFVWNREEERKNGEITIYGNVDIREVDLGFRVFGKLSQLLVDEGDSVEPGQLLAELDAEPYLNELEQSKSLLEKTAADLHNAQLLYNRRAGLASSGSVSQESIDEALYSRDSLAASYKQAEILVKQSSLNISDTRLTSPSSGIVLSRVRESGAIVKAGDTVFILSVTPPVWIRSYVSEPLLGRVYPGMPAQIVTDTKTNPVYEGHVGFISPVAEFTPKSVETTDLRTDLVYRVRIIVDNPDEGLRQGMPVTVKLRKE